MKTLSEAIPRIRELAADQVKMAATTAAMAAWVDGLSDSEVLEAINPKDGPGIFAALLELQRSSSEFFKSVSEVFVAIHTRQQEVQKRQGAGNDN